VRLSCTWLLCCAVLACDKRHAVSGYCEHDLGNCVLKCMHVRLMVCYTITCRIFLQERVYCITVAAVMRWFVFRALYKQRDVFSTSCLSFSVSITKHSSVKVIHIPARVYLHQ